MNLDKLKTFAIGAFSDKGVPSYSRIASFSIIVSCIAWVSYVTLRTMALPDLNGPTIWITGGTGATYGVNRFSQKKDEPEGKE